MDSNKDTEATTLVSHCLWLNAIGRQTGSHTSTIPSGQLVPDQEQFDIHPLHIALHKT